MNRPKKAALLALSLLLAPLAAGAAEVNLYTTREPGLMRPLTERFTQETGIGVNTVFVQGGLAERLAAEGGRSRADVAMVVDVGNLMELVDRNLTQPVKSATLEAAIPANLRDAEGRWFALSTRARAIYASRERIPEAEAAKLTYEELAEPRFKGKVCIRSGQHPYNTALFSILMIEHGETWLRDYLTKLKGNLARRATGGDREVARDILAGICDVGLANTYYAGLMLSGRGGEEQKRWGEAVRIVLPANETAVNISGGAVTRHAPNRAEAVRFLEFLASPEAQQIYADGNFENPVRPGTPVNEIVDGFGPLVPRNVSLPEVAARRAAASRIVDEVGFDR
ncbi:extracellular solute-binding protein [Muricoccus pecuniae]|uniref:Iron(III) transport system substrate-binding protein n=1 Tax=Muricoccus pecuniae TaxID=693023 RepID=A0A840YE09_9PROT|nr:extracellular solute-binding protein [Roseomonas pecuniae]MBB5692133.1 iron(III) transport system substrate-binding protein [Roseomonas pecuniae]